MVAMEYIMNLDFNEDPNYDLLISIFSKCAKMNSRNSKSINVIFHKRANSSKSRRKLSSSIFKAMDFTNTANIISIDEAYQYRKSSLDTMQI
jgi:hypothetical protein